MLRHYYTLFKLADTFKSCIGWCIEECFSQDKNSIIIKFTFLELNRYLIFHTQTEWACIYLSENFQKAQKNIAILFPELIGEILQDVEILQNDRVLMFSFMHTYVYATLFGGSKNNFILTDKDKRIINALNKKSLGNQNTLQFQESNLKLFDEFPNDTNLATIVSKCEFLLGKHYADELIYQHNLNPSITLGELINDEKERIKILMQKFRDSCLQSNAYYILSNDKSDKILSLIALHNYPIVINKYNYINEAVKRRFIQIISESELNKIKQRLLNELGRRLIKLEKILQYSELINEIEQKAELYRLYADLLMAYPHNKDKHGNEIKLKDWQGNDIIIALDDKLNLIVNAEKYYNKARKIRNETEFRQNRIPRIKNELTILKEQIEFVKNCNNIRELRKFMKSEDLGNDAEKGTISSKFRQFELAEGFTLFVGKSASNNDELTMKFAKPNDYWFHARGYGGSHCVLKQNSKYKPPKHIIEKAGEIAGYYSKGRKSKYIPVIYTQKKYVRKPKGSAPGAVVVDREEVIMVQPRLPDV